MLEIIRTSPTTWSIGFKGKNGVAQRDSRFSPHLDEFEAKWLFGFEKMGLHHHVCDTPQVTLYS